MPVRCAGGYQVDERSKTQRVGNSAAIEPDRHILILGNLQSGKTMLFRQLCGERTHEIGIPKTSLTLMRGRLRQGRNRFGWRGGGPGRGRGVGRGKKLGYERRRDHGAANISYRSGWHHGAQRDRTFLLDTPGTLTLFPQGEEEMVARNAILQYQPDALLVVADAKNIRRSLALVAHAAEFRLPMVLALNMEDEAWRHGIEFDIGLLSSRLGIDVIPTVATESVGIHKLRNALLAPRIPKHFAVFPSRIESCLRELEAILIDLPVAPRAVAQLLVAEDTSAWQLVTETLGKQELATAKKITQQCAREPGIQHDVIMTEALHTSAQRIAEQVVSQREVGRGLLSAFGRLAHQPLAGSVIAVVVIYLVYLWVGELGATRVVDAISDTVFNGWLLPQVSQVVDRIPWPVVRDALMDPDFGLIPTGLFLAFGLVMPVLFFFYFAFNILLFSGYIPRISILMDRIFRFVGLNGKGILPLTMGLSCVTMALITTRMLDSKRERMIASFLLLLGTPCAPLLAMMIVVLANLPLAALLAVFITILAMQLLAGVLAGRFLSGRTSDFIIEIPPMRVPRFSRVLRQTVVQTWGFMKEAVPLFLLASLVMFTVDRFGGLALLARVSAPLVQGLLGLPEESVQVFVKTMIRRETGAVELDLVRDSFSNLQLVVTLVVMTLLTPCVNSVMVLIKERGFWTGIAMLMSVSIIALLVGAVLNNVCSVAGITFD